MSYMKKRPVFLYNEDISALRRDGIMENVLNPFLTGKAWLINTLELPAATKLPTPARNGPVDNLRKLTK